MGRSTLGVVAAVLALPLLAACSGGSDTYVVDRDWADDMGYVWPLTADRGEISCPGSGRLVIEVDGTEYALNGLAKGDGYPALDPVWADSPDIDGAKVDVGSLIEFGNDACGY